MDRKGRFGRALAEFAIVVVGVLVALFVESWWQGREHAGRAEQYLVQLSEDAGNNARDIGQALAEETEQREALEAILATLSGPEPISRDAAVALLTRDPINYSDPRVRLGTIDALVSTGDFRLVGDPEIRSALISYSGEITADLAEFDRWVDFALESIREIVELKLSYDLRRSWDEPRARSDLLVSGSGNTSIAGIFATLHLSNHNRIFYLRRMAGATDDLLAALREREASGGSGRTR